MCTGSQTVPAAGRGALCRVSKRIRRGWKRRTAGRKHGPRLRVCWKKVALMDEACLPDASAETDEDGTAVLDALRPGLYLLSGQSVCVNRQICTPSPMLIVCPAECAAEPELTRSPEKADYSVQIVWDDETTPEQRPGSLPVQLMCDGKPMAARFFYPKNRTGIIHGAVCRRRTTGHLRARTFPATSTRRYRKREHASV